MLSTVDVAGFVSQLAAISTEVVTAEPLSCGITMRHGVSAFTVAASDGRASNLDESQYLSGDGPCLNALRSGQIVHCEDLQHETRWPDYVSRALGFGLRCSLSLPLSEGGSTFGAMNVYGFSQPGLFTEAVQHQYRLFAAQAAGALRLATRHANDTVLMSQLEQALNSRTIIDQAIGILIGRHQLSADRAFDLLRAQSQTTKRKLRDIAADVVAEATGQPPRPGRPFTT